MSRQIHWGVQIRAAAAIAALLAACSGGDGGPPDAGDGTHRLEILDPPGDSIGLAFTETIALRVRYLGPDGEPIAEQTIGFELVAGPSEDIGASALSGLSASTDGGGAGQVNLTAGARAANFRVRATAPGAPPALFFVVVSETGFASIAVEPIHAGPRAAADFTAVEYRLFSPDQLSCATLDIDDLPESVFPPRRGEGFAESVRFRNLAAERPYVLVAWAEREDGGARLATGCVELAASQVRVGPLLHLALAIADRPLDWSQALAITSALISPDLAEAVDAALGPDPWTALGCPLGPAQLILDCSLDAVAGDGDLDCAVSGSGPIVDDVEALRGPPNAAGCRPAESSPGVASIDQILADAMTAGPWTAEDAPALALGRDQILAGARLTSELVELGPGIVHHRLLTLTLQAGGGLSRTVDLLASARPVVAATHAASIGPTGIVSLEPAAFTLDFDRAAEEMFSLELLPARGLGGREADLGAALAESFEDGAQAGCAAVSALVCDLIGRSASCLTSACGDGAAALDARLLAWIGALAAGGLDFTLAGAAAIEDRDFDLELDTIGNGSAALDGTWTTLLSIASGVTEGVGGFGGQR
jgi:hypothetical protein